MAYMALYRKWRPQDFDSLVGQEHIRKTLANAIEQGKVAHAYLFSGSRGTGKTSTAKILAKALNCEHGPTPSPCNQCSNCQKINDGSFMDVFEIDAASNRGIDEIRELRETVKFAPVDGRYKVYIIDEVHMLTTEAFNALLKTLEEPPEHVVFILATTEVHKVPITIQSRCQRYDFKRITKEDILSRLETVVASLNVQVETAALELIALQADGGMRDALSLLDQCLAFAQDTLTVAEVKKVLGLIGNEWIWTLMDKVIAQDSEGVLQDVNTILSEGKEIRQLLEEFTLHLRALMLYQATNKLIGMEMYLEDESILQRQSQSFTHNQLVAMLRLTHETLSEIKWVNQPRISLEIMLLKLCWRAADGEKDIASEAVSKVNIPVPPATGSTQGISSGKIISLEQKLASMERVVKALSKQLAEVSVSGGAGSGMIPVTPMNTVSRRSASVVDTGLDMPAPALVTEPPPNLNLQKLWQQVITELNVRKKMAVATCIVSGFPYKFSNNQLFVNFKSSFLQKRTERQDYKELLETILSKLTGISVKLIVTCNPDIQASGGPVPAIIRSSVPADIVEADIQDIPLPDDADYHEANSPAGPDIPVASGDTALAKALDIFGGSVIPENEIPIASHKDE